jgi:hypothetical protein
MKSDPIRWTREFLGERCPCGSGDISGICCWRGDGRWEKAPVGRLEVKETTVINPSCYLSSVSNCSAKLTKEHFISRNILERITDDNTLKFENAGHFFGGKSIVQIGIDGFSSKILCDNHNSALSPLDETVGAAFGRIEEFTKDVLRVHTKGYRANSFHIASGLDIERWMIKVFCGLAAAGKIRGRSGKVIQLGSLPRILFEALIGTATLEAPLGLHMHTFVGQIRKTGLSFGTLQLTDGSDEVGGLLLSLGLLNFVLVTSNRYNQAFNDTSWFRHQTLAINIIKADSKLRFLFTY